MKGNELAAARFMFSSHSFPEHDEINNFYSAFFLECILLAIHTKNTKIIYYISFITYSPPQSFFVNNNDNKPSGSPFITGSATKSWDGARDTKYGKTLLK